MDDFEDEWALRDEALQRRVIGAVDDIPRVIYAAFSEDDTGLPIDNLDHVAVAGPVQLVERAETRQPFGERLESPTWLTLACCAHALIDRLYGFEQRALVGIEILAEQDGVRWVALRLEQPR